MDALADVPKVVVVNESHLDPAAVWNMTWALNYQARWQFGPLWKSSSHVIFPPAGVPIPAGAWVLHLLDEKPEEEGTLGFHDEDGEEIPFSRIFVKTSEENGFAPSEVASHELLEMLVDPHINATAFDPESGRLYAMEVCDPCEGLGYDLGAPYGRTTGITVADFVLPSWFDPNTGKTTQTDYRAGNAGPFSIAPTGYASFTTKLPPEWEQEFGDKANKKAADNDDRVIRRAGAKKTAPDAS